MFIGRSSFSIPNPSPWIFRGTNLASLEWTSSDHECSMAILWWKKTLFVVEWSHGEKESLAWWGRSCGELVKEDMSYRSWVEQSEPSRINLRESGRDPLLGRSRKGPRQTDNSSLGFSSSTLQNFSTSGSLSAPILPLVRRVFLEMKELGFPIRTWSSFTQQEKDNWMGLSLVV